MGKTLSKNDKVLYAGGDSKNGQELVRVTSVTTTPKRDSAPKPIACPTYKTLCQALQELAAYERKEGEQKFIDNVLNEAKVFKGEAVINHHPISGGGSDEHGPVKGMEDSEFKEPRLPYFVDIEYIEIAYALRKRGMNPYDFHVGWVGFKNIWSPIKNAVNAMLGDPERSGTTSLAHRPNRLGVEIGKLIAERYKNLTEFTEEFCKNAC